MQLYGLCFYLRNTPGNTKLTPSVLYFISYQLNPGRRYINILEVLSVSETRSLD